MSLTPKAQELLPTLRELWAVFSETNLQLLQKQKHNLLFALEEAEALWANFSELLSENLKKRQANNIEIVDYRPKWKADFKRLNLEWIEKYFKVEQTDIDQLNHPEAIIYSGGCIILAQITEGSESEIVGTAALIPDHEDPEQLELIKMAVSPRMQGKQIGKKLALAAIQKARDMGAKRIFLESNTALQPAMELYKKVGFQKVQMRSSPWERANIQMVLEL